MDCLEAQRIVSEKLDGTAVEGQLLESAKQHCRTCPDCAAFVRGLLAVGSVAPPRPPDALHDRIMTAVRRESDAIALLASQESALAPAVPATEPEPSVPTRTLGEALARLKRGFNDPRNERTIIAWTVAASMVFIAAGIGATMGVRLILAPSSEQTLVTQSTAPAEMGAPAGSLADSAVESSGSARSELKAAASAPSGSFISVAGTVFRATGPALDVDATRLKPAGTTISALDGRNAPIGREVKTLDDPARVYIVDDAGVLVGFERVTRSYDGREFALQSGGLPAYNQWPSLPSSIQRPSSPDGSPVYRQLGTDSLGVTVYGFGGSASSGILVAPGTPGTDPAGGNPDWTWWTPVPQ